MSYIVQAPELQVVEDGMVLWLVFLLPDNTTLCRGYGNASTSFVFMELASAPEVHVSELRQHELINSMTLSIALRRKECLGADKFFIK